MRVFVAIVLAGTILGAHAADDAEHKKELIEQHRAIAAAHLAAAECLESGKTEEACHQALNHDCKKLPIIGARCGMRRHRH